MMRANRFWWGAIAAQLMACGGEVSTPREEAMDAGSTPDSTVAQMQETPPDPVDAGPPDAAPPENPYQVCSKDNWCFDRPEPTQRMLLAGARASDDAIYVVGEGGTVLWFDGKGFRSIESGVTRTLRAAFAFGPNDVWAVGDGLSILRSEGSSFRASDLAADAGASDDLYAVWGAASDDVWAVGSFGALWHFDGASWSKQTSPTTENLRALWGVDAKNVFAVGDHGTLLSYDGMKWTKTALPGGGTLNAIDGQSETDLWVVGNEGRVLHFDGNAWMTVELTLPKVDLLAVYESSPNQLVVLGKNGFTGVYDGMSWHAQTSGVEAALRAIVPLADGYLTVGDHGSAVRWQGDTRITYSAGSRSNYLALFGSEDRTWIAGDELLEHNADGYRVVDQGTERSLFGGHASSSSLALAVGTGGAIVRWDGAKWSAMQSGTNRWLRSVWAPSMSSAWVVGEKGLVLGLFNGTKWQSFMTTATVDLYDVWGASPDDVWIAGEQGLLMHWDSNEWKALATEIKAGLRALWGSASSDVWAAGTLGTLAHWDGKAWSIAQEGAGYSLNGIWGKDPKDVYAVGSGGTILHFDGEGWKPEASPTSATLFAVGAAEDGQVRAVGQDGVVLIKH